MNPSVPDFKGDVIHGKDRTFYSVRFIALCMAVAALTAGAVSVPVVLVLTDEAQEQTYENDIKACESSNNARRETNIRLITQRQDAENLGELTDKIAKVRKAEAKVFTEIAKGFNIETEVAPLIQLLQEASERDLEIAAEQKAVIFKDVPIRNCNDTKVVPKP